MADLKVQQQINSYVAQHTELMNSGLEVVLSRMVSDGIITKVQAEEYKKTQSAFGFGFGVENFDFVNLSSNKNQPTQLEINAKQREEEEKGIPQQQFAAEMLANIFDIMADGRRHRHRRGPFRLEVGL